MYHDYHRKNMPSYKLTYFNARARAETIRMVFGAAGVKFEDNRIEFDQWGALKASTPFGQVPFLEVNGKKIGQSITIARFVAREVGLAGKNAWDQAQVDSVADTITDIREKGLPFAFEKDEKKKATLVKEYAEKTLPDILSKLEKFLSENDGGKGWLVGKGMTWADLHFYTCCELAKMFSPDLFKDYPKLAGLYERVEKHNKVAEYLKNRPVTPF